jgi:C-methyltransferase C-terminal domain/Methyltransferase domain
VTTACPLCQGHRVVAVLHVKAVPVHQNLLAATEAEALGCPRGDIALSHCLDCGFVFNAAFDARLMSYTPRYDASQAHSPAFRRYLDGVAEGLVDRHRLRGKMLVEIGCGDGDFLVRLCRLGESTGVGFDPSHPGGQILPSLTIVPEPYGPAHGDLKADLICARHVIEHLDRPAALLELVRSAVGDRADVLVCFETPRLEWILERVAFWDVFYEHCSYFAMPVLRELFERCGFVVTGSWVAFEGQYQWLEARPARAWSRTPPSGRRPVGLDARVEAFAAASDAARSRWLGRVEGLARDGGCVVWGAGAKGVTFLNALGLSRELVPAVVDLNPRKQGSYVPGTGQPVVAPPRLRDYAVRHAIVMNPYYAGEIEALIRAEGLDLDVVSL